MPEWLRRLLEASGKLNPDHVGRSARTTFCRDCGAVVVRGLDGERCGFAVTVDPVPLSAIGEVLALASGRATYQLAWTGGRYELDHRDQFRIAGRPAGEVHAVADHVCRSALPPAAQRPGDPSPARPHQEVGDEPPF